MSEKPLLTEIKQVMDSALARTRSYFESEFSITTDEFPPEEGEANSLTLLDMTAVIGLGGTINLFIAFSFEENLIRTLYEKMTEGMKIAPDEVTMLKEATAGEIINTVIGHCTVDLQTLDQQGVSITPPTVLGRVKTLQRFEEAMFYTRSLITPFGRMDVDLIGPRDLFDTTLERQPP
ncbi:MAG: chemotaxis protein CheX [Rhodocyclaceae bacterium]|nr:chemotaxis protein CheX [Rhodocyclaceae bacterium]